MAHYDFGLRGPRDTMDPRFHDWRGETYYDRPPREAGPRLPNRVTARYNMDYVRPTGERYPHNPNSYAGDAWGRNIDEYSYRRPYITRGGTWTYHGVPHPIRYDYRDYGPNYGGRYRDEIG